MLRGMFALAIYDSGTKTLLLARDRFGIKPLFYSPGRSQLAFASEINALREIPGIELKPDRQAVYDFAALCFIPAPETVYAQVKALQPAEILEAKFREDGIVWHTRTYHRWVIAPDMGLTLEKAADRAQELVSTAVGRQLESEVALGCLVSGGIDSSLVSTAAQTMVDARVPTFNVRFSDDGYDETWAALAVAGHIGSEHRTLEMGQVSGSWEQITSLLRHAGQPFADTSLFPVNAICRFIKPYLTVVLSGDGGDEGFGGYELFWQVAAISRFRAFPRPVWRIGAGLLAPLARFGVVHERLPDRLKELSGADDTAVLENLSCWVRGEEHRRLCVDRGLLPVRRLFEPHWERGLPLGASHAERLSAHATEVRLRLTLPNDYLFKVDTANMRESVEVRVPMLDEDLVDFGLTLPHDLKVKGKTCKRVLREVARRWLPREVADKPKQGFAVPVDKWADDDFKARVRETLLDASSPLRDFFDPRVYAPWVNVFSQGGSHPHVSREGLYQRVIMLLAVHLG